MQPSVFESNSEFHSSSTASSVAASSSFAFAAARGKKKGTTTIASNPAGGSLKKLQPKEKQNNNNATSTANVGSVWLELDDDDNDVVDVDIDATKKPVQENNKKGMSLEGRKVQHLFMTEDEVELEKDLETIDDKKTTKKKPARPVVAEEEDEFPDLDTIPAPKISAEEDNNNEKEEEEDEKKTTASFLPPIQGGGGGGKKKKKTPIAKKTTTNGKDKNDDEFSDYSSSSNSDVDGEKEEKSHKKTKQLLADARREVEQEKSDEDEDQKLTPEEKLRKEREKSLSFIKSVVSNVLSEAPAAAPVIPKSKKELKLEKAKEEREKKEKEREKAKAATLQPILRQELAKNTEAIREDEEEEEDEDDSSSDEDSKENDEKEKKKEEKPTAATTKSVPEKNSSPTVAEGGGGVAAGGGGGGGGAKTRKSDVEEESKPAALRAAAAEWEEVERINAENPLPAPQRGIQEQPQFLVTVQEATAFFEKSVSRAALRGAIRMTAPPPGCWLSILRKIIPPPRISQDLFEEAELMFCIGKTAFNNDEPFHLRIIQTIYARLNNESMPCPRYGSHWETIGFQQSDPSCDLRDLGMFSLLQLLHFVCSRWGGEAKQILMLSNHSEQHFPFAVVSINLSRLVLQSFRLGAIVRYCNRNGTVLNTAHEFYMAAFFEFYKQWRIQRATIESGGFHTVISDVEQKLINTPDILMQAFKGGLYQPRTANAANAEAAAAALAAANGSAAGGARGGDDLHTDF